MPKIKKVSKLIFNELIYGGHLQSLGAASIILVSALLLKLEITWDILFVSYLLVYPIYLHNRSKEINTDDLTNPQRTQHLKKYLKWTPIIFYFVIFILVGSLIYFTNLRALIFGLSLLIFGLLYTLTFKKITKKILFLKNIYVSVFFALLPFFLIIYYFYPLTDSLTIGVLVLSGFIFLKAFLMQTFLDIKDIESDKKEGLRTLPVIFGKEKTLTILYIFNPLITITVLIIFSLYLNVFPKSILLLIFTVPFCFYCYNLAKQKYFGYVLQSGEFLLWSFLIFIGDKIL